MIPAFVVAVPSILGFRRLPTMVKRAADRTEAEKYAVTDQISKAADQLADLWDAVRRGTGIHLPELRGYLRGLTPSSVRAAIRPLEAIPLPKTREFPAWTPRPPRWRPAIEDEGELPPAFP